VEGCLISGVVIPVLYALLLNSCEALRAEHRAGRGTGGTVSIEASPDSQPSYVTLTVTDDGSGITAQDEHRIFTSGFTTKATGAGLGLSVSRGLAESAGGTLDLIRSEAGNGASFRLRLPSRRLADASS
jgi:signal transduction histidine kinase